MSDNNTTLRQAINTVSIVGYLKKMDLRKSGNGNDEYISGRLTIETAPHNELIVETYASKMSRATAEKPAEETAAFKGLTRVMNEYVSIASLMEKGANEEEAHQQCTKVSINRANLTLNDYWNERLNSWTTTVRIQSSFFSHITTGEFAPCARFDVEGFVYEKKPEFKGSGDDAKETGRLRLLLMIPGYRGAIMPMEFVTSADVSGYIDDHYNVGDTIRVYGNMVNSVNIVKTRKPGIKEEYETTTTYVNEMLIDNGIPEPYEEENANYYKREAIETAIRVRNTETLPEKKQKQKDNEAKKNNSANASGNGFANGFATNNAPKNNSPFSWVKEV